MKMTNKAGLYIHIPFCISKCAYCDFYSVASDEATKALYTEALITHIVRSAPRFKEAGLVFDSVFIGGGTPSTLSADCFEKLVHAVRSYLCLSDDTEFSVEINPGTLSGELLDTFTSNGVNRISIGLQSSDDDELRTLSRIHNFDDYLRTYSRIREAGIDNINTDIMYGLPGQTPKRFEKTLCDLLKLNVPHISAYGLKIEPGTPFGRNPDALRLPDDETQSDMYLQLCEALAGYGYLHYEISNFAKPGAECRHNLKYWSRSEYAGFGPAAHSFLSGTRYSYSRDIAGYIKAVNSGKEPPYSEFRIINEEEAAKETVMLGLRCSGGIRADAQLAHKCRSYIDGGFMKLSEDGMLSFTDRGFLVSNYILSELI